MTAAAWNGITAIDWSSPLVVATYITIISVIYEVLLEIVLASTSVRTVVDVDYNAPITLQIP